MPASKGNTRNWHYSILNDPAYRNLDSRIYINEQENLCRSTFKDHDKKAQEREEQDLFEDFLINKLVFLLILIFALDSFCWYFSFWKRGGQRNQPGFNMDNNLKYCKTELIFFNIEKKIVENFAGQKQMVRKSYPKMQQLYQAVTGEAWPMAAFDIWIYHY